MKTKMDGAGRVVIPKVLRQRYGGLQAEKQVTFQPGEEGITITPEDPSRQFIQYGPFVAIRTGKAAAALDPFDASNQREQHLETKTHAHRD